MPTSVNFLDQLRLITALNHSKRLYYKFTGQGSNLQMLSVGKKQFHRTLLRKTKSRRPSATSTGVITHLSGPQLHHLVYLV